MIFQGRGLAKKIEEEVKSKVAEEGKVRWVSFWDAENEASRKYTEVKTKKAAELGMELVAMEVDGEVGDKEMNLVHQLNGDDKVRGIMVQLPLKGGEKLVEAISRDKDVDGLKADSPFKPATVRAVLAILEEAGVKIKEDKAVVVGSWGEVGRRLVKELGCEGMDKEDFDVEKLKQADVVISATGKAGLITKEMVKPGVVAVDVGYPQGDFDPGVADVARFFTPVPGGVGPVTVAMLMANVAGLGMGD